ncbi:MAG: hypothetical protein ABI579_07385, partial [Candidatus Sumerlaeota bacterium]
STAAVMKESKLNSSAFPKWLLRLEPHLAEIHANNRLYLIFRERRQRLPRYKRIALRLFGAHTFPSWTTILMLMGFITITVAMFFVSWSLLCCPIVVFPFIIWPWVQQRLARRRIVTGKLPIWIDEVFSPEGINVQIATDLWLSGARGTDIIQAIYADTRERTWRFWVFGAVIMNTIFLVSFYIKTELTWIEHQFIAFAFIFTLWQTIKIVQSIGIWRTLGRAVTMRYAHWRGEITFFNQARRGISDAMAAGAYILLMLIVSVYGIGFFHFMFPDGNMSYDWFSLRPEVIITIVAIVLVGFFLRFISRVMAEAVGYAMESYMREAHARYVEFMTMRVLEETHEPSKMPPVFSPRGASP